ncbi:MAG: hypothetical protein JNM22_01805 [Saprospiraceae bacterium]|nr:hypothetical protein [Saprospiraceae bacterium]
MAKQAINTIKSWFQTGDKPTQSQFWDWLDSFVHKDDTIEINNVNGLDDALGSLASQAAVDAITPILLSGTATSRSVTIPAGTFLDVIRIKSTSSMTFSVGLSAGTKEIVSDESVAANTAAFVDRYYDFPSATTIHFSGLAGTYTIKIVFK